MLIFPWNAKPRPGKKYSDLIGSLQKEGTHKPMVIKQRWSLPQSEAALTRLPPAHCLYCNICQLRNTHSLKSLVLLLNFASDLFQSFTGSDNLIRAQ